LFGRGWDGNPSWQGPVPYAQQQETLRRAAVVAAGTPNADYDYYCSDREFIDLAAGVPVVGWAIPGLELVLKEAHSLRLAGNLEEMARLCDRLLELSPAERQQMAQATRRYILAEHTQYNRCRQMIDVVSALGEARRRGDAAGLPHLPFLPAGQIVTAPPRAVLNWRG
ncbi:MAG: glycosyltransferase, partial [Acidobacteriota bacterium]|nr:glycosyltransferase [Acidobacteriota bacterium]